MKTIAAVGAATLLDPMDVLVMRAAASSSYFGLHQFIEAHPEAVFIKRTNVSVKTDSGAKKQEGLELAREIFALRYTPGIPLSHRIAIKPNLTCTGGMAKTEGGMGIITDCDFVEGVIEGMREVGIPEDSMYIREGNWLGDAYCPGECSISPYIDLAERTGIHLTDFPTGRHITQLTLDTLEEGSEVTWKDCPEGVVFRRIGYVAPFNQPNSWLLNISKFKCHGMGMTLCVKNLQGMCVHPHIHFCESVSRIKQYPDHILGDFQPDLEERVGELYAEHLAAGIPRWDKPGDGPHRVETWAQRTCDSISVTNTGLNIIEGTYGRNGNGFMAGPGPGGRAEDFMTNVLIFGKNPFLVDIIGHWLGGHEPGNFGLFHIARERALCDTINPMAIPVYLWEDGVPKLTPLTDFERTPLVTYYLRLDYDGQNEPYWHLVNEPYDYEPPLAAVTDLFASPGSAGNEIELAWAAPGGTASAYIVRYNTVPITESNWNESSDVDGEPVPATAGSGESMTVTTPHPGVVYYFAIKTQDQASNMSGISNSPCARPPMQLYAGWNLVAFMSSTVMPVENAMSSISGKYTSVWRYDASKSSWLRYIVGGPGFLNNLDEMEPGYGYWMHVVQDCVWDFGASGGMSPSGIAMRKPPFILYGRAYESISPWVYGSKDLKTHGPIDLSTYRPTPNVSLKVGNVEAGSYILGTNPGYGEYYVLEIPVDDSFQEGDVAQIYVDGILAEGGFVDLGGIGVIRRHDISYMRTPKVTKVLQNYPNPFNPETWIPFQLSDGSEVEIRIYNSAGQLIRVLDLGFKHAGYYTSQEDSARWDGRNEFSEKVASGVYFYSIRAGKYTATRKMLLVK